MIVGLGVGSLHKDVIDALQRRAERGGYRCEREDGQVPFNEKNPHKFAKRPNYIVSFDVPEDRVGAALGSVDPAFAVAWGRKKEVGSSDDETVWWVASRRGGAKSEREGSGCSAGGRSSGVAARSSSASNTTPETCVSGSGCSKGSSRNSSPSPKTPTPATPSARKGRSTRSTASGKAGGPRRGKKSPTTTCPSEEDATGKAAMRACLDAGQLDSDEIAFLKAKGFL